MTKKIVPNSAASPKSIKSVRKQQVKKFSPSIDYQEELLTFLKDHKNATEYLNTALQESLQGDADSQALFLRALKHVAEAQGTISNLAKRSKIRRESIYRIFSENGNPEMQTLATLLHAMGFGLSVHETGTLQKQR